jgi:predicted transglutaminase-like cysteine proteinase
MFNLLRSVVLASLGLCAQAELAGALGAEETLAPPAFYVFCSQTPSECLRTGPPIAAIRLTPALIGQLASVNRVVNAAIEEVADEDLYGQADVWTLAGSGQGDCEDFALLKRHRLIELGWPSSVLLITVVRNRQGEGHAVLTVPTDEGDLILDNQTNVIWTSTESGLRFYARQSRTDPLDWVTVASDGSPEATPVAVSGLTRAGRSPMAAGRRPGKAGKAGDARDVLERHQGVEKP